MNVSNLKKSLILPCGHYIDNRIAKASMTEHLADLSGLPNNSLFSLYEKWANSEACFLLTGNVIVNRNGLEGLGNIVLDHSQPIGKFKDWANVVNKHNAQLWMQIGHAGGLSPCEDSVSPSGIQHIGRVRVFPKPKAMSESDINEVIDSFSYAALTAKNCGFSGIEIHAAHQFLINQFLSPLTNKRSDRWGGTLENRARFLLEIVRSVRKNVGSEFPVGVKINSSDGSGRKDGWTKEESIIVCHMLENNGVDFIEFSGGSYEFTPMLGPENIEKYSTRPEAFFLEYLRETRKSGLTLPVMLTGGMRSANLMDQIVGSNLAQIIGIARPMAVVSDIPKKILSGEIDVIPRFYGESLPVFEQLQWFRDQMNKLIND